MACRLFVQLGQRGGCSPRPLNSNLRYSALGGGGISRVDRECQNRRDVGSANGVIA